MNFTKEQLEEVTAEFSFDSDVRVKGTYGNGHINQTYFVESVSGSRRYVLQRINHEVFRKPEEVMANIVSVTAYLRAKIAEEGGDPMRETLSLAETKDGRPFWKDAAGNYWRVYHYIEGTICHESVKGKEDFYQSALAFGKFLRQLADYPADVLYETIPGFHDTVRRLEALKRAIREDKCGRAASAEREIEFALSREADAGVLGKMQAAGDLPLRVTHNDTKLNNLLFDNRTGTGICVIDLDTVMPGLSVCDFGDSIRFGASTAAEDEKRLDRVWCDMELFEIYSRGFQEACGGRLTDTEIEMLPTGARMMTYECGVRFLTDYLEGDPYFRTSRPAQNLDRARTQFKLVWDMEQKKDLMMKLVRQ